MERSGSPTRDENALDLATNMVNHNATFLQNMQQIMENMQQIVEVNNSKNLASMFEAVQLFNPPTYSGLGDPAEVDNWIREMDKIFWTLNCPENFKVKIGTFYLRGVADWWWQDIKDEFFEPNTQTSPAGASIQSDWDGFKARLEGEFFSEPFKRLKMLEFEDLKQTEDMSVEEFYSKFVELSHFAKELVSTEELRAWWFQKKLCWKIKGQFFGKHFTQLKDVYARALHIEHNIAKNMASRGIKRKESPSNFDMNQGRHVTHSHGGEQRFMNKKYNGNYLGNGKKVVCWYCKKQGHKESECLSKQVGGPCTIIGGGSPFVGGFQTQGAQTASSAASATQGSRHQLKGM